MRGSKVVAVLPVCTAKDCAPSGLFQRPQEDPVRPGKTMLRALTVTQEKTMSLLRGLDARVRHSGRRALAITAMLGLFAASQAAVAAPIKVKAGHLVAIDMAPLFVAKESGCFEKHGLDVETVSSPSRDNNAALAGGAIDFRTPVHVAFFAATARADPGHSGGRRLGRNRSDCPEGDGLTSIADIKSYIAAGKPKLKIATLQGDTLELILTRAFEKAGIDPAKTEFVYFDDLLAMVEAFRSGKVDILSHIKPYTTDLEVNKGAKVLTTNAETWDPMSPNTVVSVLDKTLTGRPDVVRPISPAWSVPPKSSTRTLKRPSSS